MQLPIKKYVIIGSYPLNIRYSKDIDVICYEKDVNVPFDRKDDYSGGFLHQGKRVELLFADRQESFQEILANHDHNEDAFLWELYSIKAGHITFPHKQWDKHIHDLHILKRLNKEINYPPFLQDWVSDLTNLHRKCTEERIGKQRLPKLIGVSKEEFFDDAVVKYYVHDDIHKCMAHRDRPMYEFMQEDTSKVECSKKLWNAFPEEDKVKCVQEECYVIALERHIIPAMKGERLNRIAMRPFEAYKWALMRVCTTLCSGWFRQYAIDNYFTIPNAYNPEFVQKFTININKYEKV